MKTYIRYVKSTTNFFLMYTVKSKHINVGGFQDYSLLDFCVSNMSQSILYKLLRVRAQVATP